jgi:TP901 family phage tail tape measure protein
MTGKSFKDVGQAMWELKSAGLSAGETFAFMDTNMMLATQNNAKLGETIRLTVGLYRTFGDQITQATTPMEKMAYVGDTLAFVLNKSAADMNDIMQSFKYVASTANLAGVSFEEVSAALVVLHNHMIRGSTAGMSMNAMLLQLAKNWSAVGKQFDIAIDPTKPVKLAEIISKFANSSKVASLSIEQLANVFTTFEIRGGRAWATLIKHPKEFERVYGELTRNLQANSLSDIFEKQMDNLSSQLDRFKQLMQTALVFDTLGAVAKGLLKDINDIVEGWLRVSTVLEQSGGTNWLDEQISKSETLKKIIWDLDRGFTWIFQALQPIYDPLGYIAGVMKAWGQDATITASKMQEVSGVLQEATVSAEQMQLQLELGLTSEQMFALEIAKGNVSLQQQVEHMKAVTTEAYNALSAALKQHAAQKDIDKLFTDLLSKIKQQSQLEKQVEIESNKVLKEQEKQTKAIEKQQNALSKNAELAYKLREGFLAMQEATPVREVQQLMLQMEKSFAILKNAVSGTDQWRQGIEGVFTAYGKLKNVQKLIDDSFDRMISATQKLQGIGSGLVDTLMQLGDVGAARGFAESMESAGRDMLSMANSADQQVSAYDLIIAGIKERMKVEGNSKRLLRELADAYQSQWTAQRQVLDATKEQNAQLITMLTKLDAVLERLAQIFEKSKLFADSMKNVDMSNLLPANVDADIGKLEQAITQVEKQILGISFESKNLIAPEAIVNADKLNVSMVNFANTQQNNVEQASQLSNSFMSVNQNASQVLATITTMTNGLMQVTTITTQIENGIETWRASTQVVGQTFQQIKDSILGIETPINDVSSNINQVVNDVGQWITEQEALNMSFDSMNNALVGSAVSINQVQKGMDDILKSTMNSDKAFQEVTDSTDAVTKNVMQMSDNFDESQKSINDVSNTMEKTTIPSQEISTTTKAVMMNLNDWMSPIDQSATGLGSVQTMTNNVNNSVERVLSNLDRMAQKIRSMPKLNVTGGGGGMPTNNDILTNPGYQ